MSVDIHESLTAREPRRDVDDVAFASPPSGGEPPPALRPPRKRRKLVLRILRGVVMVVVPLTVLTGGVLVAKHLIDTAPVAERRQVEQMATPVRVEPVTLDSVEAAIQVMGSVMPAQEVILQPRVSGEVVELSPRFVPGGRFDAGDFVLRIDPADYELAVQRAESQVAQAEYELKLEQGRQEIARREWELLDMEDEASELDRELALRRPQLLYAEAALRAAQAAVREAELALERTEVKAPFNCIVANESIDLGAQVSPQTQLGMLVGTDLYWVQAAVPVDQLKWIRFPNGERAGSEAVIRQKVGTGVQGEWRGRVARLMSGLEPQGRMARVLIEVPEPLDADMLNGSLPLLVDAYVNVTIKGRRVENVATVPRSALRDDRRVWIMNEADTLDIREIDIVWGNQDVVLVAAGLDEGERLVTSDLPAPVAGMALTVRNGEEPTATAASEPAGTTDASDNGTGGANEAR